MFDKFVRPNRMNLNVRTSLQPAGFPNRGKCRVTTTAEWWQVLTVVTIILSIASIFLSINQAQPQNYRQEFAIIDQAKASVYLLFQESNQDDKQDVKYLSAPSPALLCEKPYQNQLPIADLEDRTKTLHRLEKKLTQLETDITGKIQLLSKSSQVSGLFSAANTYLVSRRLYFEKKQLLSQNLSEIYIALGQICRPNSDTKVKLELGKITQALTNISDLGAINRENLYKASTLVGDWNKNSDNSDLAALLQQTGQMEHLIQLLNSLDNFYNEFKEAREALKAEFAKLERWQQDFANKNPNLQENLILIDEF